MDVHTPGGIPPQKRLTRKTFLFWPVGIIALLGCVVGLFAAYLLLTPAPKRIQINAGGPTTSPFTVKPTPTLGLSAPCPRR